MEIKPDEIASILRERIEGMDVESADLSEVGTVLEIGDGIGRVHASRSGVGVVDLCPPRNDSLRRLRPQP